ncbi:MAG: glycosyltransferase family 4 protein [Sedimentisphaerales bacterium]|nr:glycosyltransferase family 4 protein [Sedimentisphaerales bacterium]
MKNPELRTKNSKLKTTKVCFVTMKAYSLFNLEVKSVFGGAEVDFYNLATELAKDNNFEVSCIVADYGQPDSEVRHNVKLIKSLDFKKNIISQTLSLWQAMNKANASIYLQKTAAWGTLFVYMFCKLHKRKFIYRTAKKEESTGDWPKNILERKAFHFSIRRADAVLAQNVKDKENLNSKLGISAAAIPNGHKLSSSIQSDRDFILWVGRSTKVKRPELFIKLAESAPDKKFLMICQRGTGDNEYDILISNAKKVNNLEYIERVEFSEIDSYFQRAKVLVNTSDTEGFPNTFIQACKAGTPILSLNVNPDDFLNKYKCGLCANSDWITFNNMLEEIIGPSANEYSKNARLYAKQNHDIKQIIEQYKEIFNNLMDGDN